MMKKYKCKAEVTRITPQPHDSIVLDFGSYWGKMFVPRRSNFQKKLDLEVGDKLIVIFKKKKKSE